MCFRIRACCPELLDLHLQSSLFKLPGGGGVDPNSSSFSGDSSAQQAEAQQALMQTQGFGNTPQGMAARFEVPYLGMNMLIINTVRVLHRSVAAYNTCSVFPF